MRANERTDERVAQYLRLYSCFFQTTVRMSPDIVGIEGCCGDAGEMSVEDRLLFVFVPQNGESVFARCQDEGAQAREEELHRSHGMRVSE